MTTHMDGESLSVLILSWADRIGHAGAVDGRIRARLFDEVEREMRFYVDASNKIVAADNKYPPMVPEEV